MQVLAEAACQHGQHISPETATSAHDGQQHKQGLGNLGPLPAACTAASNARNLLTSAADSAVGTRAGSATGSSTVGMRVADCSTSAKSPESDAAVPAVSSLPCADSDKSASWSAAAAAGREPLVSSSRGSHAAEEKPADTVDAHAEEKHQKSCGHVAQNAEVLDSNAAKMASKRHMLLGKDQLGSEGAVHSSLAPPASVGSLGSEMLGSLFCCPVTRVRSLATLLWALLTSHILDSWMYS